MSLSHEYVGLKISAKIKIYLLIRAESLFPLCYEIPCITESPGWLVGDLTEKNSRWGTWFFILAFLDFFALLKHHTVNKFYLSNHSVWSEKRTDLVTWGYKIR